MIVSERAVVIDAPRARVWRALCDPAEVVQWDAGVERPLDPPPDYPQPGHHVRWRYRSPLFRILHDRPQEVAPERTLRSLLSLGPFRFDETYTLESAAADAGTSLRMSIRAWCVVPVAGGLIERLYLRRAVEQTTGASLASIKRHCEAGQRPRTAAGRAAQTGVTTED